MTLVLVVPAYNEADRLVAESYLSYLRAHPDAVILFVDDGSEDGTATLLAQMHAAEPRVKVLSLPSNCGKGEAVRRGILAAFEWGPALIGYWDADLATPLSEVEALRDELARWPSTQLVLGSRVRLLGRPIERRAARHYLGRVFATAASLVLALPVYDTQCGAKLFRASEAMRSCFMRPFRSRWIFDVELIGRLATQRASQVHQLIRELPLSEWRDAGSSKVRLLDFVRAPAQLMAVYRDLRALRQEYRVQSPSSE